MASRGGKELKLLLRNIDLAPPSSRFTREVMKEIQAMANNNEVFADVKMKVLLRKNALAPPPTDFTIRVLNGVRYMKSSSAVYQPIINQKAWLVIGLFALLSLIVALGNGERDVLGKESFYFITLGEYLSTVFSKYMESIFFAVVVVFSATFLLTLDYWLHKKMPKAYG